MQLVSIIVRTKDRPHLLKEALKSLRHQSYPHLEIILVNDGEKDLSRLVQETKNHGLNVKYIQHPQSRGRSAAANTGLRAAEGAWIGFLDEDDLLLPQAVEALVKAGTETSAPLIYGKSRVIREEKDLVRFERNYGRPFNRSLFLFENYIPMGSFLVRKEALNGIFFDEKLSYLEDWDFLLRVLSRGDFYFIDQFIHIYRLQEESFGVSKDKKLLYKKNWLIIYERYYDLFTPEVLYEISDLLREEFLKLKHQQEIWQEHFYNLLFKHYRLLNEHSNLLYNFNQINKEIEKNRIEIEDLKRKTKELSIEIANKDAQLALIYDSLGWKLLTTYRLIKDKIFPLNTKRRNIYDLALKGTKVLISHGPTIFIRKTKNFLKNTLPGRYYGQETIKALPSKRITAKDIKLPKVKNPQISIIIPVYNKIDLTLNCLFSISQNTKQDNFEVIIIDDASSDATPKILSKIENLKYIRHKNNKGFLESISTGVKNAQGEILVFLNNDTFVTQNWLKNLLKPLANPKVGIVGAKLVYPNGRLQEAGGIIFRDASGWNYGKNDDPSLPEYNFLREVDYCSGACLAISRTLFLKIGGFEECYRPAYYEDTDLAFKIRNLGYKTIYQPKAIVFHLEGASCGTNINKGIKKYQAINQQKFKSRWKEILEKEHFPPNPKLLFIARERLKKGIILISDHYVPMWDKDSGSLRMFHILNILNKLNYKIIFWPDNLAPIQPYTEYLQEMGIEIIYGQYNFEHYIKKYAQFIDLLWACRVNFAKYYIPIAKKYGIKTIFDTVDLHFLREEREGKIKKDEKIIQNAKKTRRLELSLCKISDKVSVVSKFEKDFLKTKENISNVVIIPNIHKVEKDIPEYKTRKNIMFIGSFLHPPNEDAVYWFVKEIWPQIKQELANIKFFIIGSSPTRKIKRLANKDIIITGYVPNVEPFFKQCRVFVAPLRYGAGLKGKVGQAMAYGLPAVLTPIAAEGLDIESGEEALIASDSSSFAKQVIRLYQDENLWKKLSLKSRQYIEKHFSPHIVEKNISHILTDLIPTPKFKNFFNLDPKHVN